MPLSDEELVARHLAGDQRAFAALVERYTGPLYSLSYRATGDRMEAENITQDTFLRAYAALPKSRLDLPLRPWLFRICINLCRNWSKRRRATPFSFLEDGDANDEPAAEQIAGQERDPLSQIIDEELQRRLYKEIDRLPPTYRTVIDLRYTQDLSYEEIAQVTEIPLNTVRSHLRRAKLMLTQRLKETDR